MTTKLAHQTQKAAGIPNGMRTATIVSVSTSAITININGGQFSSGVGVLGSYRPAVGDTVAVFRQDSSWLILGAVSTVGGTAYRRMSTANAVSDGAATSGTTETPYEVVTIYAVAGETYHLKAFFPYAGDTLNDRYLVRIRVGGDETGVQLTYSTAQVYALSAVYTVTPESDWVATSTGYQSFCTTVARSSGSGALTPKGATGQTRFLTAEHVAF